MENTFDFTKGCDLCENSVERGHYVIADMSQKINDLFQSLVVTPYIPEKSFFILTEYINKYDRIWYSSLSKAIYDYNNAGNILFQNIESLLAYVENLPQEDGSSNEKIIDTIIKIYDHISLAVCQHDLKTPDEYLNRKFDELISETKNELWRDAYSQIITVLAIFTALAFLVFGSISSLANIFQNDAMPLSKIICLGLAWGVGISNMIFVFLHCVEKLISAKNRTQNKRSNFIKDYPVVLWTNGVLVLLFLGAVLCYCLWEYPGRENASAQAVAKAVGSLESMVKVENKDGLEGKCVSVAMRKEREVEKRDVSCETEVEGDSGISEPTTRQTESNAAVVSLEKNTGDAGASKTNNVQDAQTPAPVSGVEARHETSKARERLEVQKKQEPESVK